MKIVLLNTSERTGGAAVAANRLMHALNKAGHEAKMLVRDKQTTDENVVSINTSFVQKKINFTRFAWERLVIFARNRFDKKNLFAVSIANTGVDISKHPLVKDADIIHTHWINQGFLSLKNIKQLIDTGKPIVWTMHDMWAMTGICHYSGNCEKYKTACCNCPILVENKSNDLSFVIFGKKEKINLGQIHYVGCSQWIAEKAKSGFLLKNANILSIPNPINTEIFYPKDKNTTRQKLQLPLDKHLLLFSAAKISDNRKGGTYFIDACKLICEKYPELAQTIEIVWMGNKNETFFLEMNLISHSLHYISSESEAADVYSAVDVYVIPSLEDNLPNTIMEALACGTPCVGFNIGGIPEMIDHKKNGYVAEYKSVEDLANGIYEMLFEADYKQLSLNARQKAIDCYSEEVTVKQYVELYNKFSKMNTNHLTDRNFWQEYWKNYNYEKIPTKVPFEKFLPKTENLDSFIEIGGFPGVFSGYFYTKGCKNVSLLDFYIDENMVRKFEGINNIPENTIHCIESEFFTFKSEQKYDIVFSSGFIEHFEDTKDVIQRHAALLSEKKGACLLIILPNFRGLNGFVQSVFDRKNFCAHNLNCMDRKLLKNIVSDLGLKNITVEYSRKPMIWLEPKASTEMIRKLVKLFSYGLKLFPVKCRLLSPYIMIYAEK